MEILYSWALKVQFYYLFYIVKHLITQDMRSFFFRFYSTNSSFVHGGFDKAGVGAEPAYGQQEIHARITQVVLLQEVQLLHSLFLFYWLPAGQKPVNNRAMFFFWWID